MLEPHQSDPKSTNNTKMSENKLVKLEIIWINLIFISLVHLFAVFGICALGEIQLKTLLFCIVALFLSATGTIAGAHRLWSHRSYKASFGLRLALSLFHLMSGQNDLYYWVRDHRTHHKFTDTDADPTNIKRGLFYAYIGCVITRKHQDVTTKGNTIDFSDLEADPIVSFQRRHFFLLLLIFWGLLPASIPVLFWSENLKNSILVCVFLRHAYMLNISFMGNSITHMFGTRSFTRRTSAVDATVRQVLLGEGCVHF